jgi:hypothetical protein
MSIPKSELKHCPKCGSKAVVLNNGKITCGRITCLPFEMFTESAWQKLERHDADRELMAAELSADVRDVRIGAWLDALIEILEDPDSIGDVVRHCIGEYPVYDNPVLDAKAARLRELVS